MKKQPKVIYEIAEYLSQFPNVERVILFGSRARGDERERSDIDLVVVGSEITRSDWHSMQDYLEEARTLLSIDLLHFEKAPNHLKKSIESEGVTLYERYQTATVH